MTKLLYMYLHKMVKVTIEILEYIILKNINFAPTRYTFQIRIKNIMFAILQLNLNMMLELASFRVPDPTKFLSLWALSKTSTCFALNMNKIITIPTLLPDFT